MAIDPEVKAMLALIDRRIAKLQRVREDIASEFSTSVAGVAGQGTVSNHARTTTTVNLTGHAPTVVTGLTRKAQVLDFIREHGPKTRAELTDSLHIPVGTISFVLNDKALFRNDPKTGKWDLKEDQ